MDYIASFRLIPTAPDVSGGDVTESAGGDNNFCVVGVFQGMSRRC